MKITKRQLRRIIKEETSKILTENKVRQIVRQGLTEIAEGETLIIDYRSPPSGIGTLEQSNIVVQYSGSQPSIQDQETVFWQGDLESKADFVAMADWLRSTYGVTHVRDSELPSDGGPEEEGVPPDAGDRYTLNAWLDGIGEF